MCRERGLPTEEPLLADAQGSHGSQSASREPPPLRESALLACVTTDMHLKGGRTTLTTWFVVFLAAGLGAYPLSGGLFEACGWRGVVVASAALVCGLVPVLAVDAWRQSERDINLQ